MVRQQKGTSRIILILAFMEMHLIQAGSVRQGNGKGRTETIGTPFSILSIAGTPQGQRESRTGAELSRVFQVPLGVWYFSPGTVRAMASQPAVIP